MSEYAKNYTARVVKQFKMKSTTKLKLILESVVSIHVR